MATTDSGDTPTRHNVRFAQDSDGDRWSSSRWLEIETMTGGQPDGR